MLNWFSTQDSGLSTQDFAPPFPRSGITRRPGEALISQFAPYIGYVAGALTVLSFLPQVLRAWRTKQTKDLSLGMFVILITAGLLWLAYGVITSDWPVIATNGGMVLLNVAILVAKLRFR